MDNHKLQIEEGQTINTMAKKKKEAKIHTLIHKTPHRKLKIEQHETHLEMRVNSCILER